MRTLEPANTIIEGTWVDFRDKVKKVEPELFAIIEKINPSNKYKLIMAEYLYGEKITDQGCICVPDTIGRLVKLDNPNVPEKLKAQLGYCPTPLTLQLTNSAEVFVDTDDRIIPFNVFKPGDLYGLYEVLVPFTACPVVPCWSITSGGRSVFLAAKISDHVGHKRLRAELALSVEPPKRLKDHWHVIKEIANHSQIKQPWRAQILMFTNDWFNKQYDNDINWMRLQAYLYKKAWLQSRGNRIQVEYSIMWESFAKAICDRHLKPNSYIVDTVKHQMSLASGAVPGFKAISNGNEIILPSTTIEKVYTDIYGLKEYAAIIMYPHILMPKDKDPIYYSMAYPTLLAGTPAIRKSSNVLGEIREVRKLMLMLERELESYEERIYQNIKNVNFEYFHSDDDRFGEILNSEDIPKGDALISSILSTKFENRKFPSYGQFFRGCIRISHKQSGGYKKFCVNVHSQVN